MERWDTGRPSGPSRNDATGASRPQAPTSFVQVQSDAEGLPLEFLNLPAFEASVDVSLTSVSQCFVCHSERVDPRESKNRLQRSVKHWLNTQAIAAELRTHDDRDASETLTTVKPKPVPSHPCQRADQSSMSEHVAMFATYSSLGVVDLGATKTVIGSQLVKGLLEGLSPQARKTVRRCPCAVTFRFGNQGTLQSEQALAIPIHGFWLKIAVVPGSTPFLLSNTLLRAIGAVIDASRKTIFASKINKLIPIQLTERGLFLLDLNDLVDTTVSEHAAETHQVSEETKMEGTQPCTESDAADPQSHVPCSADHNTSHDMSTPSTTHKTMTEIKSSSKNLTNIMDEFMQTTMTDSEYPDPIDPRSSNCTTFAKSFRFPKGRRNVFPEPAFERTPSARRNCQVRFQPSEPQPTGRDQGGFRTGPFGSHIPRDVVKPSGVASLVCRQVREVREGESSEDPPLRSADGGTGRNGGHSHRCSQRGAIECDSHEAESQGLAQEVGSAAERCDFGVGCRRDGGVRGVWRRDQGGDERGSSLRGSQFECGSPGDPNAIHGECTVSDSPDARNHSASNRAPVDQCPSWAQSLQAGDPDRYEDHVSHVAHETNRERRMFNKLIHQISP